jgi:hypothetical protein
LGEPNDLVDENPYYLELGADAPRRQERWREFLLGDDPKEEANRRADGVTGKEGIRQEAKENRSRQAGRARGRSKKGKRSILVVNIGLEP